MLLCSALALRTSWLMHRFEWAPYDSPTEPLARLTWTGRTGRGSGRHDFTTSVREDIWQTECLLLKELLAELKGGKEARVRHDASQCEGRQVRLGP